MVRETLVCERCSKPFEHERKFESSRKPRFCSELCRARKGRPPLDSATAARNKRSSMLQTRYGVTVDEWDQVYAAQGNRCAGCGTPTPASGRNHHSDHDHKTGVFRGILCWQCNNSILRRGVTSDILRALADYLDNPPGVALLGERRGKPKPKKRRKRDSKFGGKSGTGQA